MGAWAFSGGGPFGRQAARGELARRLQELRRNQVERRRVRRLSQHECDELGAVRNLVYRLFSGHGVIEIQWGAGFEMVVGFKSRPAPRPDPQQRGGGEEYMRWLALPATWLFRVASHKELVEQIAAWRAHR